MTQDKRPPVGATGTLAELMVETGDVFQGVYGGRHRVLKNRQDGAYITECGYVYYPHFLATLISRANPDQPPLKIEPRKYYRTHGGKKAYVVDDDRSDVPFFVDHGNVKLWHFRNGRSVAGAPSHDLIAEWQDDQPPHIITHNERTYDLTTLETPFGLLLENAPPVADALKTWPYGVEYYGIDGWSGPAKVGPSWHKFQVYRAKPKPTETRVLCYRGQCYSVKSNEIGTCIRRADGSIDWASWEPEA